MEAESGRDGGPQMTLHNREDRAVVALMKDMGRDYPALMRQRARTIMRAGEAGEGAAILPPR